MEKKRIEETVQKKRSNRFLDWRHGPATRTGDRPGIHARMRRYISPILWQVRILVAASSLAAILGLFSGVAAPAQAAAPPASSNAASSAAVPGRFVDVTEKAGVHFLHQA